MLEAELHGRFQGARQEHLDQRQTGQRLGTCHHLDRSRVAEASRRAIGEPDRDIGGQVHSVTSHVVEKCIIACVDRSGSGSLPGTMADIVEFTEQVAELDHAQQEQDQKRSYKCEFDKTGASLATPLRTRPIGRDPRN